MLLRRLLVVFLLHLGITFHASGRELLHVGFVGDAIRLELPAVLHEVLLVVEGPHRVGLRATHGAHEAAEASAATSAANRSRRRLAVAGSERGRVRQRQLGPARHGLQVGLLRAALHLAREAGGVAATDAHSLTGVVDGLVDDRRHGVACRPERAHGGVHGEVAAVLPQALEHLVPLRRWRVGR